MDNITKNDAEENSEITKLWDIRAEGFNGIVQALREEVTSNLTMFDGDPGGRFISRVRKDFFLTHVEFVWPELLKWAKAELAEIDAKRAAQNE
jgi:hypothetical protein